jgi:RNA polymerase sigma factor (sigma-70 family)
MAPGAPPALRRPRPRTEARLQPTPTDPARAPLSTAEAARFRALVLPHADAAYNLALRLAKRADVAEDLVHDAYVRALGGFRNFRGGDARSWILTIVRNRFLDWLREQRLKATASLVRPANDGDEDDSAWDVPDPDQLSAEEQLARAGEAGAIRAMVDRLPPRLREVIVLREMEDMSYREIAAATESPIGSVMSRLARARSALAAAWREREAKLAEPMP